MVELTKKYLLRQGFWIYLFTFLAAPLGYLIRILYARAFSIEEFGLIYSIIGFIALISIFNDLGFSETLNYYATRFYEKKQYAKVKGSFIFALLMQGGTAILLGILFWFLSPWLAEHYFKSPLALDVFRAFLMYFFFFNISTSIMQLLHATHNYLMSSLSELLRQIMIVLLSVLLFYYHILNSKNIGIVWSVSYFILCFIYFFLYKKYLWKLQKVKAEFKLSLFKKLASYAIFAIWTTGAYIILTRIDVFMITFLLNIESVGYYTIAYSLANIIALLFAPIMSIFFPITSKHSLTKSGENEINNIVKTMYSVGIYLILPVVIILAMFPNEIINIMFGAKFLKSTNTLVILSFAFFFAVLNNFNISIMSGFKMLKEKTTIMVVAVFINIILNLLLIPIFNIEGAAIATLLTFFIINFASQVLLSKKININFNFKIISKILICNISIGIIIYLLKNILALNMYLEAIIISLIVAVVYLLLGSLFNIFDNKIMFKFIKEMIHKKI